MQPAGTSTRNMAHWAQGVRGKASGPRGLRMYDWGTQCSTAGSTAASEAVGSETQQRGEGLSAGGVPTAEESEDEDAWSEKAGRKRPSDLSAKAAAAQALGRAALQVRQATVRGPAQAASGGAAAAAAAGGAAEAESAAGAAGAAGPSSRSQQRPARTWGEYLASALVSLSQSQPQSGPRAWPWPWWQLLAVSQAQGVAVEEAVQRRYRASGRSCNQEKYGQLDPPAYDFSRITTPLAMFTGQGMLTAPPMNIRGLPLCCVEPMDVNLCMCDGSRVEARNAHAPGPVCSTIRSF